MHWTLFSNSALDFMAYITRDSNYQISFCKGREIFYNLKLTGLTRSLEVLLRKEKQVLSFLIPQQQVAWQNEVISELFLYRYIQYKWN